MASQQITKSISFKKDLEPEVMQFIREQSNFTDSVIYLIQKEIAENGVRNLQMWVPQMRTVKSVGEFVGLTNSRPISVTEHRFIPDQSEESISNDNIGIFEEKADVKEDVDNNANEIVITEEKPEQTKKEALDQQKSNDDIAEEYKEFFT